MKIACLLFIAVSASSLGGCLAPQQLPNVAIKGHVIDLESRRPVSGAKIRLIYHGATKTIVAGKEVSPFMDPIEVGAATTDASGRFEITAPARFVRRPLVDSWPQHPDIWVSGDGYEDTALYEMDLTTRYSIKHGIRPEIPWPYSDDVEIYVRKKSRTSRSG